MWRGGADGETWELWASVLFGWSDDANLEPNVGWVLEKRDLGGVGVFTNNRAIYLAVCLCERESLWRVVDGHSL